MQQKTRWMAVCLAAGLCAGVAGATTITSLNTSGYTFTNEISGAQADTTLLASSPWINDGFSASNPNNDVDYNQIVVHYTNAIQGLTTTSSNQIKITTPSGGESAVLLTLYNNYSGSSSGGQLNVDLSDGETFTTSSGSTFWFSSSDPVTSITVSSDVSGDQPFIASLSYATSILAASGTSSGGTTSPIPEPATLLLVAAGGLIFFGARRRWFRSQA